MGKAETLAEGTSGFLGGFFGGIGNLIMWLFDHIGATELVIGGLIIGCIWLWLMQDELPKYFQ